MNGFRWPFLTAIRERLFARRMIKRLLAAYTTVAAAKPELGGQALYREVLLHSREIEPSRVDEIIDLAEDSIDEWTAPGRDGLGFREVVHFLVLTEYQRAGNVGTIVPFGEIVNDLIPENL
jgi:hypothetical protein